MDAAKSRRRVMQKAWPTGTRSHKTMQATITRIHRGLKGALRTRTGVLMAVATAVLAFELVLPPAVLSIVRKPFDYFAFNAWLPDLPAYVFSSAIPLQRKLEFLPNLALFWLT